MDRSFKKWLNFFSAIKSVHTHTGRLFASKTNIVNIEAIDRIIRENRQTKIDEIEIFSIVYSMSHFFEKSLAGFNRWTNRIIWKFQKSIWNVIRKEKIISDTYIMFLTMTRRSFYFKPEIKRGRVYCGTRVAAREIKRFLQGLNSKAH